MNWDLPLSVNIDGKDFYIRNKCEYRVVLDAMVALNDQNIDEKTRIECALYIFFEDLDGCNNISEALKGMMSIINGGEKEQNSAQEKPKLMDWEHDFKFIAPAVSKILGYDVRDTGKYTHWYSFLGAFMEIGECTFATIVSIRSKRIKGKKLDKFEEEFFREHRNDVLLPQKITADEQEILDSPW